MKSIEDLAHPHLVGLEPYVPGMQPSGPGWIKLNTNESPYPPAPRVAQAIQQEFEHLPRYPNPTSLPLREAISRHYGLSGNQVLIGNGSDDILNLLVRCFGGAGRVTADTFPSYSLYPVLTAIAGGSIQSVPFGEDFSLPVDALARTQADLLFLTCPNAPTGIRFPMEQVDELSERFQGLLVVDEAYAEFAETDTVPLLRGEARICITRTFSKAYGLAGLRVGYCLAPSDVVDLLDRVRDSYNVNRLSQAGALAALEAQDYYRPAIEEIKATRERTRRALQSMGWQVYRSEANFLFAEPVDGSGHSGPAVAAALFHFLEQRKILVRYFPKHPLTAQHLRISIGSPSQMERFLEEVVTWQKNA